MTGTPRFVVETPDDWRALAECKGEDPELFFRADGEALHGRPRTEREKAAKSICERCVVKADCLTWAMETGQADGVWGGLNEDERRALKRRQNRRMGASVMSIQ